MTPVSEVLAVQPTPLPWSARQAQMSSRITLLLLTTSAVVALPAVAPPIRKNTSDSADGSEASLSLRGCPAPTWSRTGEVVAPASNRTPETSIPFALATVIDGLPLVGTRVGNPSPRTTESGRLTWIGWSSWYTPGVRIRFLPRCNAVLMVAAESDGCAMKKLLMGSDVPGAAPAPQVVPAELTWAAGTKTL